MQWRQFAWNVKYSFLVRNKKNIINLSSAELAQTVVKVKYWCFWFSWNFHQNVGFDVWSWNKTEDSNKRAEGRQKWARGGPALCIGLAGALWPAMSSLLSLTSIPCLHFEEMYQGCAVGGSDVGRKREEICALTSNNIDDIDWTKHPHCCEPCAFNGGIRSCNQPSRFIKYH